MWFSFQERRKRKLVKYEQQIQHLSRLSNGEFNFEYIELQKKYHFRKNILSLFLIAFTVSILSGVWTKFFSFSQKALTIYFNQLSNDREIVLFVFIFLSIIIVILTLFLFVSLYIYLMSLTHIKGKILIMDQVKQKKGRKK